MKHYKCSSKTGRECCLWLFYSIFCSSNLHVRTYTTVHDNYLEITSRNAKASYQSSVATDEMVHRLGQA
ncbi:hypothetical protein Hanom_Chr13g01219821 [Helianthus anomalus]